MKKINRYIKTLMLTSALMLLFAGNLAMGAMTMVYFGFQDLQGTDNNYSGVQSNHKSSEVKKNSVPHKNLTKLVDLKGSWLFNIGDDIAWANPKFNDESWATIQVPNSWEKEGYVGYDGYAWYRKKVMIPSVDPGRSLFLYIGNIDDDDVVYLNGNKIGRTGALPPDFSTAYNWERRYLIPEKYVVRDGENVIAIRVYDEGGDGGIINGEVAICVDNTEEYLKVNLAGTWKFKVYDDKAWKEPDFNDSDWSNIRVPMSWEGQGLFDYNGYAWYRKSFKLPENLKGKHIFLSLGKIDDYDQVYFNGECIGEVTSHKYKSVIEKNDLAYNTRRVYEIPSKLIHETNVIAVRVYDKGGVGGIYEGPIGIMDEANLKSYKDQHDNEENNYYNSWNWFGDLFDWLFN